MQDSSLRKIMNFPLSFNGYASNKINEHSREVQNQPKWHMEHKPYANDYPRELIKNNKKKGD